MQISTSKQHSCVRGPLRECRSIRSGASGLPYYCTPLVYISDVIGLLSVWRHNKPKTQKTSLVTSVTGEGSGGLSHLLMPFGVSKVHHDGD